MPSETEGSITRCLVDLKAGDHAAAQRLWDRYFDKLVHLARTKIRATHRQGADEDEEDAALSAFDSFCAGAARGQFPQLADRQGLWQLLVVITARKALTQVQRRSRRKRGGGQGVGERAMPLPDGDDLAGLDQLIGPDPSPDFAAMVGEQYLLLLTRLGDESLRQIAIWRMEGYTNDEIAEKLGCARRTVARRIELIRKIWLDKESR
jgi:DNA-directed RNA polymerase specialized sigma24 family protein